MLGKVAGRRDFLRLSGSTLMLWGTTPSSALSSSVPEGVLVVVFQRGAADALHMVVPYRERSYRKLRGNLALREPGRGEDSTLDLGDGFAFHPALKPLYSQYEAGRLAVLMNVGSPDPTRSHFDAQDYMESGTPGRKSTRSGWLARAIGSMNMQSGGAFTAVALAAQMPRSLAGADDAIALEDFSKLDFRAGTDPLVSAIEEQYGNDRNKELSDASQDGFEAMRLFREKAPLSIPTREGVRYPGGRRGNPLRQLAQLIKGDLGIRVALVNSDGWDTHFGQGAGTGQMANLLNNLSGGLAAFVEDVGSNIPMTVLVVTEFGRTVAINGAGGTDHGHGGAMLVLGGRVQGSRVYGDWIGLDKKNLHDGRDLPVTTDYRDVFYEVAESTLDISGSADLFPGYLVNPINVMRKS